MDELGDFLKGPEPIDPATDPVVDAPADPAPVDADPVEPPKAEQPRGPDGKFIPKGETEPVEPASVSPTPQEPPLEHAALIGERRRRQEAEQEREALRQQIAQLQQQQPAPEFWDDPDQAFNHRLQTVLPEITERIRNELRVERVKESAEEARTKYQDYDETIDVFHQLASQNPALGQQMMMSRNPAEFAYKTAKTHQEVQQYGSLDQLIEAKLKEREAARSAEVLQPVPQTPIPETLADAQSSRGSTSAPTAEPKPLNAFLGGAFI